MHEYGDINMNIYEAERKIKKRLPTASSDEIRRAIDSEASAIKSSARKDYGYSISYGDAVEQICDRIIRWIECYAEYNFDGTLKGVYHLFTKHRYACAWAVLAAYLHNHKEAV